MIDWQRVAELRDEVGEEDFDEIIEMFLEDVEERLQRMHAAQDNRALGEDIHFLKGCALNMGFRAFSALCQRGEGLSSQDPENTIDPIEFDACYQSSKRFFLSELPKTLAC